MNLLLVDDEEYVIENIMRNVGWADCGIDEVYTAFSMKQAQNMMEMTVVDVIICDIVMPQETGFDFVGWVRDKGYDVQVIFLTSYAEFHYAHKAISLDSVDYLLKPIDFERFTKALAEAVKKAQKARQYEDYRQRSLYWKQNQSAVCRDFWRGVIAGDISSERFHTEAQKRNLYYRDGGFYLIYIVFYRDKEHHGIWDGWTLNFAVGNVLSELLEGSGLFTETVLSVGRNESVVVCREIGPAADEKSKNQRRKAFEQFVCWFVEKLSLDLWCGVATVKDGTQVGQALLQVRGMRDNSLSVRNRVLYLPDFIYPESIYQNPNMELWEALMEEGKEEALTASMRGYLENMEKKELVTRQILESFRADVTQIVYSWLAKQEIKAHLLFSGQENEMNYQNSLRGQDGALAYASSLIRQAINYRAYVDKSASVTEKIRQYIDSHYQEEIRRDALAEMVYLNTDYMSRIFKREYGVSISSYILQKRVEEAKKLLSHSTLPINTVSIYVGYSNFSYFTKMFKKNTGYSPLEYRRKFKHTPE